MKNKKHLMLGTTYNSKEEAQLQAKYSAKFAILIPLCILMLLFGIIFPPLIIVAILTFIICTRIYNNQRKKEEKKLK